MKCLLDTHVVLWALGNRKKLSEVAARTITDPVNEQYVSMASAWELAIKISVGKLVFNGGIERFFRTLDENNFKLLPITAKHVKQVETLPLLHRDPFDRILIASAMIENMCVITADTNIHRYEIASLW